MLTQIYVAIGCYWVTMSFDTVNFLPNTIDMPVSSDC